jgi:DNA-binding IclR family transcriptional regulator
VKYRSNKISTEPAPVPGAQAVFRAIALLKAFSGARAELSLDELARLAGLKKTTAFRLLAALERESLVAHSPHSDAYRLGPGLLELAGLALRSNDLRSVARPELEKLARQTGETVSLEILVEGEVLILDEVQGSHLLGSGQWIGTRWPAHATSTGKALLAALPDAARHEMLAGPLARPSARTLVDPDVLEEQLREIRRRGYSVADEELEPGFVAVGAAVFNFTGEAVGAVSAGGPALRLTPERIPHLAALVMDTAACISKQLGY